MSAPLFGISQVSWSRRVFGSNWVDGGRDGFRQGPASRRHFTPSPRTTLGTGGASGRRRVGKEESHKVDCPPRPELRLGFRTRDGGFVFPGVGAPYRQGTPVTRPCVLLQPSTFKIYPMSRPSHPSPSVPVHRRSLRRPVTGSRVPAVVP